MARQIVTSCDAPGEHDDDVQTLTIRCDGKTYEVDLCAKHREPVLKTARRGREVANLSRVRDPNKALESRIRNHPDT